MTEKKRRDDRADEPLRFMSFDQYRQEFGREPVLSQPRGDVRLDAEQWPGWTMPWPPPTVIVVMAEWTDTALWNRSADRDPFADDYVLDPEVLGVSLQLTQRMRAWNDRYGMEPLTAAWVEEGRALAYDLQSEFDARRLDVEVLYHDEDGQERAVRDRPQREPRR